MTVTLLDPPAAIDPAVLAKLLNDPTLPSPPAVAMQIVQATSRADCEVKDVVELLARDPAICGQVLRVINSSVYGLTRSVSTIERAVVLLGLNTVRSIVLTFSLPAMQMSGVPDTVFRDHCLASVSGAVIARELSVRVKRPMAEDDLVCGLLRDLGTLLLRRTFPEQYATFSTDRAERPFQDVCRLERERFGVDHPTVTAELLTRWNLPGELIEPIRHHHSPDDAPHTPPRVRERAELLWFVEGLTNLDLVAHDPAEVDRVLGYAKSKYDLSREGVIEFLQEVLPKIETFAGLLSLDVGKCPDYAATLATGCNELAVLAVKSSQTMANSARQTVMGSGPVTPLPLPLPRPAADKPAFRPEFVTALPPDGCDLDGYHLLNELGRGAMGVVFLGYEPGLDRHVAVKMMTPEMARDENARLRFAREARSVAAVRHENVVGVYAVREAGPLTYLVMEYMDGGSLDVRLRGEGRLPAGEVIGVAEQVAAGLAAAHAKGIIHRDVKPANLLLDAAGRVKITDFGLARVESDVKLSATSDMIGTPLYMCPEQVFGLPLDPRADLFSLGAVLYTLLVGAEPFRGSNTYDVITKVCELHPPSPGSLVKDVPGWFDQMVMRLLAKSRDDRFGSADEVVRHVRAGQVGPASASASEKRGGWKKWLGL
jgi:HD-like signal output (HDOD) protein/tRNA A-37 threonylcarbamoyl transferase component Bud32